MGKLKKFLKETAGLFIIAGITGAGYCYLSRPDGIPLKAEADGILTAEEQERAEGYFVGNIRDANMNDLKAFINDFDVFTAKEFEESGLEANMIDEDLHISPLQGLANIICKRGSACYAGIRSTIYIRQKFNRLNDELNLLEIIEHEIGHTHNFFMTFSDYLDELPSQSNEMYSMLKMYSFNKAIGAEYVLQTFDPEISTWKKNCISSEGTERYILGRIGFLVQANKAKGNLEQALYNVFNESRWSLGSDSEDTIGKYGSLSLAYFGEYEKLLQQPLFIDGLEKHMSHNEAQEFISYLQVWAGYEKYQLLKGERTLKAAYDIFKENAEFFLQHSNNPLLVDKLTEKLWELQTFGS